MPQNIFIPCGIFRLASMSFIDIFISGLFHIIFFKNNQFILDFLEPRVYGDNVFVSHMVEVRFVGTLVFL